MAWVHISIGPLTTVRMGKPRYRALAGVPMFKVACLPEHWFEAVHILPLTGLVRSGSFLHCILASEHLALIVEEMTRWLTGMKLKSVIPHTTLFGPWNRSGHTFVVVICW